MTMSIIVTVKVTFLPIDNRKVTQNRYRNCNDTLINVITLYDVLLRLRDSYLNRKGGGGDGSRKGCP